MYDPQIIKHMAGEDPLLPSSPPQGVVADAFQPWVPSTVQLTPKVEEEPTPEDEASESVQGEGEVATSSATSAVSAVVLLDPATVSRRVKRKSLKVWVSPDCTAVFRLSLQGLRSAHTS